MNSHLDTQLGAHTHITKLAGFEYTKHFDYAVGGEIIALRSLNIRHGRLDLTDVHTIPKDVSNALPRSKLRRGDIVLGYVGSKLGNLAKIDEDNRFHLAPNVALIRPSNTVSSEYLLQYMQGPIYQARLWSLASSTGQPALSMANIRRSKIWLPPLPEQKKIAEILSTWDKAIETTEKLLANAEAQKKALMQHLLTGKRRLKGFEGEWRELRLGEIGSTFTGLTGKSKEDFGSGKAYIPYLNIFINSRINISNLEHVNIKKNENQSRVRCGDFFFTTSSETPNEVGMSSVILDEVDELYLNSFCFGFRLHDFSDLQPRFGRFLFRGNEFRRSIRCLAQGATRYNLSKTQMMRMTIAVPPLDEQLRIAEIIETSQEECAVHEQTLQQLRSEKQALMQQLLTGKRRVTV